MQSSTRLVLRHQLPLALNGRRLGTQTRGFASKRTGGAKNNNAGYNTRRGTAAQQSAAATGSAHAVEPKKSSGLGLVFVLALGLSLPSGFIIYNWKNSETFRSEMHAKFPWLFTTLVTRLGATDDTDLLLLKDDLVELEERLEAAGQLGHEAAYSATEVAAVKALVDKAVDDAGPEVAKALNAEKAAQDEADAVAKEEAEQQAEAAAVEAAKSEVVELEERLGTAGPEPTDAAATAAAEADQVSTKVEKSVDGQISAPRRALRALRRTWGYMFTSAAAESKQEIARIEAASNRDLEEVLARDLTHLDMDGLRRRLVQLTLELKDRNRWEVLRMHEMIKAHDNDVEEKFQKLLREQAEHFDEELLAETEKSARKAARTSEDNVRSELVHEYSQEMEKLRESFQKQLETTMTTLETEREKEVGDAHKQADSAIVSEKEKHMANLARAQARIRALEDSSAMRARNSVEAVRMLKITAALFDLLEHKDAREPLDATLKALSVASKGDKTIAKALAAVPERVSLVGVPSISDLSMLFASTVREECVRLALTQPDGNMMTNALASLTARVKLNQKGLVEGDDVEASTSRTQFYLEKGDLAKAVAEVERLNPHVKDRAAKEWLAVAKDRLAVEQAAREIKAHVTTRAKELASASA